MKKLVFILILLFCYSCNTDDSNDSENNNLQQNSLSKIITTTYALGQIQFINRKTYVNNLPISDSIYNVPFDAWIYEKFIYNNKLIRKEFSSSTSNQIDEYHFDYDNLGRIVQTTNIVNSNTSTTTFTFEDQVILSSNNTNGTFTSKVFHLNDDGIIYKEFNPNETIEYFYDDDYNVLSTVSSINPTNVNTYDNTNSMPLNTQIFENFVFGNYKNNHALSENSIGGIAFSYISSMPKYHLSATGNNATYTYQWTLNNNGYPLRTDIYNNNQQIAKVEYLYE